VQAVGRTGPAPRRPFWASSRASRWVSGFAVRVVGGVLVARAAGYSQTSGLLLTLPRRPFRGNLVRLVRGFGLCRLGRRKITRGRRPCKHALCFLRPPALGILAASDGKEIGLESLRRGYSGPQEADTS
jgi:hypothetical protein